MTFKARGLYASSSKVPRRPRMGLWLLLGALLALALVAATVLSVLGNVALTRQQTSDTYQNQERVEIDNRTSGSVEITTADTDQIHIERTLSTSPLHHVEETIDETGDSVQLQAHCPGPNLFFTTCAADYEITLPQQSDTQVHTTTGQIHTHGLQGQMQASTTTGQIHISNHQGPVQAESTSALLQLSHVQGPVQAQTVSGDIELTGQGEQARASTTSGQVDLSGFTAQNVETTTTSGEVNIGDFTEAQASSVSGSIHIRSNQPLQSLTVDTTSGNVNAQIPEEDYHVSGNSTSGDREIAVATSPQAGARITIDTVSGSVQLTHPPR
ncbi:DUF4097 family beta strand repeat-containing protein [Nocardiopsis xinjiangensis]|uniref:DUF4097 family beta strand repeat-containing protein n=1 Tax=Nocardiopsis xinjiangensis TaxID=124285 RepID=UPI0003450948|nr:DUF4097 family beta strand repeat-containing protein [Nocardiopsis xinjiangensis]